LKGEIKKERKGKKGIVKKKTVNWERRFTVHINSKTELVALAILSRLMPRCFTC
jgi:hypothetical protein